MPEEIGRLTLHQFNSLIHQLARKFNWDVQVAAISAGNKLESKHHPLHPDKQAEHRQVRESGATTEQDKAASFAALAQQLRGSLRK